MIERICDHCPGLIISSTSIWPSHHFNMTFTPLEYDLHTTWICIQVWPNTTWIWPNTTWIWPTHYLNTAFTPLELDLHATWIEPSHHLNLTFTHTFVIHTYIHYILCTNEHWLEHTQSYIHSRLSVTSYWGKFTKIIYIAYIRCLFTNLIDVNTYYTLTFNYIFWKMFCLKLYKYLQKNVYKYLQKNVYV